MKPFNLEKALAGEPISYKGFKSYLHCSKKEKHVYIVESDVTCTVWSPVTIKELAECTMWEEPRPMVTLTLPCPLKEPRDNMWYIDADFTVSESIYDSETGISSISEEYRTRFGQGLYFATEENAQAWVNAFKNNRR